MGAIDQCDWRIKTVKRQEKDIFCQLIIHKPRRGPDRICQSRPLENEYKNLPAPSSEDGSPALLGTPGTLTTRGPGSAAAAAAAALAAALGMGTL